MSPFGWYDLVTVQIIIYLGVECIKQGLLHPNYHC